MFTNSKHEAAHEALKKGEVDKAIFLYTEALNQAPNDCDILSDRATAFLHKKDKLRSMTDFNKAVELDPNYSFRYAARAFAKQNFGDLDGAVEDYRKAVELDPEDAVAQNNLGMLLEQQGYKEEADERFARADKLSKMEDRLYDMMDEMESEGESDKEGGLQEPQSSEDDDSIRKEFEARTAKAEEESGVSGPEDDLEKDSSKEGVPSPSSASGVGAKDSADNSSKTSKELKKVFTSRQQFREFVRFVKNGFKIK
ncbi:MAG: hypothetical protein DCO96_09020 [Fluviicola sp. XM-24bin1]|nr:MAG: hypothetical protein DCO96_09020 [Fluviicola sp. XM-24bin1]